MRILHVAYIYPPELGVADGITTVVFNVTKELAKRGHEVTVYTSDKLDLHDNSSLLSGHAVINGVNVYYSRSVWRSKSFIVTPNLSWLLKKLSDHDVVHIHDCRSFQGITAYLFSRIKNVPFIFQSHGSYLPSFSNSPCKTIAKTALDKLVGDKILQNATKIITTNEVEAEQYKRAGIPEEKISVVPNGIDISSYVELPHKNSFKKKFGIPDSTKILLYLGRIHASKGIDLLIDAYSFMIKTMKTDSTMLIIAGPDDGYLPRVKLLANSLGISDSVIFTGFIDNKDKLRVLVDADLFVTPSFSGFPLTFLEAGITGTPIVTTTLGDSLDWIDGKVGRVTSPTKSDLAKAFHDILFDDSLREEYSKNCRKFVKNKFSLERVVDQLCQLYSQVIS